ncbi:MAG: DUF4142 domain-containing protein [Candidatus Cyclobacteriaceae bacterium M2_1C_046]
MKKLFLLTSLLGMCLIIFSCDTGTQTEEAEEDTLFEEELGAEDATLEVEDETHQFLVNTTSSSKLEVQLGQLAADKAQNEEVKDIAQQLVEEHKNANDKLQNVAQQLDFNIPEMMKEEHREKVEELQNVSGNEFDSKYIGMVIDLHNKDIDKFQNMQDKVEVQELKDWIGQTLPKLKDHKQRAEQIQQNIQ